MQTFLPYRSYEDSAANLDWRRLGKQRVECKQIVQVLDENSRGNFVAWSNHPAVRMWRGYEQSLISYAIAICEEWIGKGYKDTCLPFFLARQKNKLPKPPPWLGGHIHVTHQSNLIRKDPEFYRPIFGDHIPDDMEYHWPV